MTTIALFGAGGKMGFRLSRNLQNSDYEVRHVEVGEAGRARLKDELGIDCVDQAAALDGADVAILAVPDTIIKQVAHAVEPSLKKGALMITLDPAAPMAGHLPNREDLGIFVAHPCHTSMFYVSPDVEAQKDFFGGGKAPQDFVCALLRGTEAQFELGEAVSRAFYAPINQVFRLTVEQMAILEPVLVETIGATFLSLMREAMDEAISRGCPPDATRSFLLGHINILSAIFFEELPGVVVSDACQKAINNAKKRLMQPDWKKVFESEELSESIRQITE